MPQGKNWTRDHPRSVVGTFDKHVVFGGLWVQFSPRVRRFSLSRAIMISPPSKLKVFTGSVCVLLTSVSLKLIKIKIKFTHESVRKKQNGGWKLSDTDWFYFSFYSRSCFFSIIRVFSFYDPSWSESNFILFLFFYLIWVGPSRSGLIRSDFCTCLFNQDGQSSNESGQKSTCFSLYEYYLV